MNLEEYVQHWDNKINKWFLSPNEVVTDKDDFQYEYMPEPYIGNPYNPSSVILNFNPGIGVCHSWMALKDVQGSLIHKVANSTYSKVFMDFPYLRDGESIELLHWDNSPGRKWWKERYKWIDHIVNKTCGNNGGLMPFALELCPWHSAKWNSNKFIIKLENDDEFKQSVETNVISVFEESPEFQNIDARDISFLGFLVATINLVDERGTMLESLDVKSEDLLKLKKLLQGKKGDEEIITFQGEFHNKKEAPNWFSQAAAFTPHLTADIQTGSENTSPTLGNGSEVVHQVAIINDPDGYTNVRARADGKAEIVAKIVDGERFFFDEVPGSKWVKVYRTATADAECIGYMHSSRVMPVGGGIAAMTEDDEEVDLEIGKMIDRFETFVNQLERVETIDEVYLKRLEKEYKEINKSAEGISFHNLPPTQQKRVRELRNKMEKEVERIKKLRYGF